MLKTYKEIFNFRRASYLLEHFDEYPDIVKVDPDTNTDYRNCLRKYIKNSEPVGKPNYRGVSVHYKPARGASDGRLFAQFGMSMQPMPSKVRAVLADGYYYDVDMVNAHPTILLHICQERKVDTPCLKEYVETREAVIDRLVRVYGSERSIVKVEVLKRIYGSHKSSPFDSDAWFNAFKKEMNAVLRLAKKWFPNYYECARKNKNASTLSRGITAIEAKLLETIEINLGCSPNAVLVFDGIMVPIDQVGDNLEKKLRECEYACLKTIGVPIKLKTKPFSMPKGFKVPEDYNPIMPTRFSNSINDVKSLYRDTEYYWYDFHREMTSQVFSSKDTMLEVFSEKIKRVAIVAYNMEDHLIRKISDENMFQFDKKCPRGVIRYTIVDPMTGKDKVVGETISKILDNWGAINEIPHYNRLDFRPVGAFEDDYIEPERTFNSWSGFKAKLVEKVDMGLIQFVIDHMKAVWASGDDDILHYLLCWFKLIFTNPRRKSKVAIVLKSKKKQIGKGLLINELLIPFIFGNKSSMSVNGLDKITGRFNQILMNKIFINCDELSTSTGYHSSFDTMKTRITDPTSMIEIKGGRSFPYPDFCNYIMTTNHDFTIHLEPGDARYCILECSPVFKGRFDYFNEVVSKLTQEVADHFFTYVCKYDNNGTDIRNIPMTPLKRSMLINSISSPARFLMYIKDLTDNKENDFDDWDYSIHVSETGAWIKACDFYSMYKRWAESANEKKFSSTSFGRALVGLIDKKKSGVVQYDILSINVEDILE